MRIEYCFEDLLNKHYSTDNPLRRDISFVIEDMSKRYEVHKKTVQSWMTKDIVPKKYIKLGDNTP